MYRSVSTHAIVIRRLRQGEYHKTVWLLTSDLGLVTATAYGAYKMQSHLRMGSEPFTYSRVQLYHNPVSQAYKVTELDVRESFSRLQSDLERLSQASLWAEIALRSYAAGETSDMLFRLFLGSLRLLDVADVRRVPYIAIQFLWRFLRLAGYQSNLESCDRCGSLFSEGAVSFCAPRSHSLVCGACGGQDGRQVPAGARRYLAVSQEMPLEKAVEIQLDAAGLVSLRDGLPAMVQSVLESELLTLRSLGTGTGAGR